MGKKEEDDKKRAEEEAKRKEEEAKMLRQQQATLAVLRVLQKLSNANPDNFDALNAELAEVLKTDLPETGAQLEVLKAEAERVLEYAKQYVQQVKDQQKKEQEAKEAAAKKKAEAEEMAKKLMEEIKEMVTKAEEASAAAHTASEPLATVNDDDNVEVLRVCKATLSAGKTAMVACTGCDEFLKTKRATIDE